MEVEATVVLIILIFQTLKSLKPSKSKTIKLNSKMIKEILNPKTKIKKVSNNISNFNHNVFYQIVERKWLWAFP